MKIFKDARGIYYVEHENRYVIVSKAALLNNHNISILTNLSEHTLTLIHEQKEYKPGDEITLEEAESLPYHSIVERGDSFHIRLRTDWIDLESGLTTDFPPDAKIIVRRSGGRY